MKKAIAGLLLVALLLTGCAGTSAAEAQETAAPELTPAPVTDGEVSGIVCTVTIGSFTLNGSYTGTIAAGVPDGEGSFSGEENGRIVSFNGTWEQGRATDGTLSDSAYLLTVGEKQYRGHYEGESVNGLPSGEGIFTGRNEENIDFTYSGAWDTGTWNGYGELIYDSALYYDRKGTFTAGRYTPTNDELLNALGTVEPYFTVSDAVRSYLSSYSELLDSTRTVPTNLESNYRYQYTGTVKYDNWIASPEENPETWLMLYKYEILSMTEETCFGEEYAFTRISCCNSVCQQPVELLVFGESAELQKELLKTWPYITIYGIPIAKSSYVNSIGQSMDTIVMLAGSLNIC